MQDSDIYVSNLVKRTILKIEEYSFKRKGKSVT